MNGTFLAPYECNFHNAGELLMYRHSYTGLIREIVMYDRYFGHGLKLFLKPLMFNALIQIAIYLNKIGIFLFVTLVFLDAPQAAFAIHVLSSRVAAESYQL